jgi:hypothetical protein
MKLISQINDKSSQRVLDKIKGAENVFVQSYAQHIIRTLKISVSAPYETYFIPVKSIKPASCKIVKSGLKYFILNNQRPVSTVDVTVSKKEIKLSHFTFGGSVDAILAAVSKIERIKKYPADTFNMKIIKCTVLNIYALRLDSAKRKLYFNLNSRNKLNELSEREFYEFLYDQKNQLSKHKIR